MEAFFALFPSLPFHRLFAISRLSSEELLLDDLLYQVIDGMDGVAAHANELAPILRLYSENGLTGNISAHNSCVRKPCRIQKVFEC